MSYSHWKIYCQYEVPGTSKNQVLMNPSFPSLLLEAKMKTQGEYRTIAEMLSLGCPEHLKPTPVPKEKKLIRRNTWSQRWKESGKERSIREKRESDNIQAEKERIEQEEAEKQRLRQKI